MRLASIPFIINFIAALLIAHRNDIFQGMFPALMLLFAGLFFLVGGAGKLSLDAWLARRAGETGARGANTPAV